MIKTNKGCAIKNTKGIFVHGCNAQGKMGSGVAKVVREQWPEAYYEYHAKYNQEGLKLGEIIPVVIEDGVICINAITQEFYGYDGAKYASYSAIVDCFRNINTFINHLKEKGLWSSDFSINFPLIASDLGGLKWELVSELIDEVIDDDIPKNLWILE